MSKDLTLEMRLFLEANQFKGGLRKSGRAVTGFTGKAKRELKQLKGLFGGIKSQLAGLGVAFGGAALAKQSARLDKSLVQTKQTAGATTKQARELRTELFRMAKEAGQGLEKLHSGFDTLIQSGLDWDKSLATIDAINPAMAVTSANAKVLASGMTVAAQAFDFDLSQPGLAVELLDKMTVAGRAGNAELENISSIFARVGVNAKTANLSFDQTLGFLEQLSLNEINPEKLATLADSTLRLFTNESYKQNAQKRLGIDFYNDNGSSRDPFDVLGDIQSKFKTLKTDRRRAAFIEAGFGQTDLDTKKGLLTLLSKGALSNLKETTERISNASGAIDKDLKDAINNAIDQTGRLKATLREAADEFAKPFNDAISQGIKFGLDKEGLGLSGKQIVGGGIGLVAGTALAARYGGKGLRALGGKIFGTAGGLATGKALEAAAGVTPVYVVNMPAGGLAGTIPGFGGKGGKGMFNHKTFSKLKTSAALLGGMDLKNLKMLGIGALGTAGAAVIAAGAAGVGIGTLIDKYLLTSDGPLGSETGDKIGQSIGEAVANVAAFFGNEKAQRAVDANKRLAENIKIKIEVDAKNGAQATVKTEGSDLETDITSGLAVGGVQ